MAKNASLVLSHPSFPCSQLTLEVEVGERGVDGVQVSTKVSIWQQSIVHGPGWGRLSQKLGTVAGWCVGR